MIRCNTLRMEEEPRGSLSCDEGCCDSQVFTYVVFTYKVFTYVHFTSSVKRKTLIQGAAPGVGRVITIKYMHFSA